MKQQFFSKIIMLLTLCSISAAASCNDSANTSVKDCNSLTPVSEDTNLENVLENIGQASSTLETFQCSLSYLTIQDPEIVDSRSLQTGKLYYQKDKDKERSRLRIRFEQLQQDDFDPEEYIEDYYFDGVWLTKVDYKLEQINLYQQAPENKPVDVFELINDRFPLIGFSGAKTLRKDFNISVAGTNGTDPNEPIQLLLNVKKDSNYRDSYKKIDFWIDKNSYSPLRVKAYSTQGDIYDIRFLNIYINKKLKNAVFTIETPAGFRENREPLETAQ
ncbi:MAG: outer membrane lipoprotein carrier protein LolA [Phycisphaerae bacterium]|nr:outer membrane lipoprotein carrier protein LolA [Phycisphaerae bacterium]